MSSIFDTKVESETLTSEEIAEISGCTRRHDQIEWLEKNHWVHHKNRAGMPIVGRLYARLKLAGVNPSRFNSEPAWAPDFSKLT